MGRNQGVSGTPQARIFSLFPPALGGCQHFSVYGHVTPIFQSSIFKPLCSASTSPSLVCVSNLSLPLSQGHVIASRAHPENPGQLLYFKILNPTHKSTFPYKMTFTGAKDWDIIPLWGIIQLTTATVNKAEMLEVQDKADYLAGYKVLKHV